MKKQIHFRKMLIEKLSKITFLFVMLSSFSFFGQQQSSLTVTKTIEPSTNTCNAFDVSINVEGVAPKRPQEVVLVIDHSNSMGYDAPNTPLSYAKTAAIDFVNKLFLPVNNPTGLNKVSIVTFGNMASTELHLSSDQGNIINVINGIYTRGGTNIEGAMINARIEFENNGTFDCQTERNIILLTDGVATANNAGAVCSDVTFNTTCQLEAITAGQQTWEINKNGIDYPQNVFTIGLTGSISGTSQEICVNTLHQIQNEGEYYTENNVDLTGIYSVILDQLNFAAKQIAGQSFLTSIINPGFSVVSNSIDTDKGTATLNSGGDVISWDVSRVNTESIYLRYQIIADNSTVCGTQNPEATVVKYEDPNCTEVTQTVATPDICVPCPVVTASVSAQNCSKSIDYSGTIAPGSCGGMPTSEVSWEFFLNNVSVGTANDLVGTFEYTGSADFTGAFKAVMTFMGSYGNGCTLPGVTADDTITLLSSPAAPISTGDIAECFSGQTLNANDAITPVSGQSVVWYDALTGGNLVSSPTLNTTTSITYYAETVIDGGGCTSLTRTPVTLTLNNCGISIIKTGAFNDENGDDCADVDETISYTFAVANEGNVSLSNIVVDDPLLGGSIAGPGPGDDDNNNGKLDETETWRYTASYTITQADIEAGSVTNQATATGVAPDQSPVSDLSGSTATTDNVTTTSLCQNHSVSLEKTGVFNDENGDGVSDIGETISYTFAVINTGNVTLYNIMITDPLPGIIITGNPIAVLQPGETDNTTFTATYVLTQDDIDNAEVDNQAVVTGGDAGGNTVTDDSDDPTNPTNTDNNGDGDPDDITVVVLPGQNPSISIVKTGAFNDENSDDCADVDETISYTFTVTNGGNVTLSNIVVDDPLLGGSIAGPGPGDDENNNGKLDVTETWRYTASYTITQADIDAGSVTNQATATGVAPDQSPVSDLSGSTATTDNVTTTSLCQNHSVSLEKTGVFNDENGDGVSDIGETISYTFAVINTGNVTLYNIMITDPLPGIIITGDPIAVLQPGETDNTTFTATYVLTQDDIDNAEVDNQAVVTGEDVDGNIIGTDDSDDPTNPTNVDNNGDGDPDDITVVVLSGQNPSISIVKAGAFNDENNDGCADAGVDTISYTFTVTNEGNVTLSNIVVDDPLLGGSIAGPGPGDDENNNGKLDVTETWRYTASYTITQADIDAGSVTNQATATGVAPDQSPVSDLSGSTATTDNVTTTSLCQNHSVSLEKTGVFNDENGDGVSDIGETISYTFAVINTGNVTLYNIMITDPLPGIIITGDPIAVLQPGETDNTTFTATYVLTQDDIDNAEVDNQAVVTGEDVDGNIIGTDDSDDPTNPTNVDNNGDGDPDDITVVVLSGQNPSISIVKAGAFNDENNDGCADAGVDTISYTFTVTNEGNVTLSNIVVDDPLLGGSIAGPGPGDDENNNGKLDVTETWRYTASYTITQADIDAGSVTNQATATGVAPDQSPVSDLSGSTATTDNVTTTSLCQNHSVSLEKTGVFNDENGDGVSDIGETISYTFAVINTGNVTLYNIMITDPLPGIIITGDPIAVLQPGETDNTTFTATYVLTQDDIDNAEVDNQAVVTGEDVDGNIIGTDDSDDPTNPTNVDNNGDGDPDDITVVVLSGQKPSISIVKIGAFNDENGDDCADVDETISYTFTVTNGGNVTLSNIVVDDPLLGGSIAGPDSGDDDSDGKLDVTETWRYTASYTITQADIDAGSVTNQATATGVAPDQSPVSDLSGSTATTDNVTTTSLCQNHSVSLEKTGVFNDENGDGVSDIGETISYTFAVINTGNVTLYNIMITDPLPGIIITGNPIAVLQPGETDNTTFTATYVLTQDDIDNAEVDNQAVVTGGDAGGNTVTDDSDDPTNPTNTDNNGDGDPDDITVVVLPGQNPSISIVKIGAFNDENGDDCADVDETISYTFTVTNGGNVTLSNIVVDDPLLGGPIAGPDSGDDDNDGKLDVTETWRYTASYTITQADIDAGSVTNQATATGVAPDQSPVSDLSGSTATTDNVTTTSLCQNHSVSLEKTGVFNDENGDGVSDIGETISYTFAVINTGNVTLYNIMITDPLPGIIITGNPIAVLQPGETDNTTFTATYVLTQDDIDNAEVDNQAVVTGGDAGGNTVTDDSDDPTNPTNTDNNGDGDPDDITVVVLPGQNPSISIVKIGAFNDENGDDCADVDETISYTFTVTNGGNVTLSNIVVDDPLLGGSIAGPDSGDDDSDGKLDVTETWRYTASYTITQADIDAGSVTNQATATGVAPDQSPVSDLSGSTATTDNVTTTSLCQNHSVSLEKTGVFNDENGDGVSDIGETISYTFAVINTGNVTLYNIMITDPLPGIIITGNPIAVLQPGETDNTTFTATYVLTQDDIDNAEVDNQAVVTGGDAGGNTVTDDSDDPTNPTNTDNNGDGDPDDITVVVLSGQNPSISIVKAGAFNDENNDGCADAGVDTISYTFTVTNEGNVTLSNIVVDDPLLGGPIAGPGSGDDDSDGKLDVTETWTYTATYTITQADIDAGSVTNQATATGVAPDQSPVSDLSGSTATTDDVTITGLCQSPAIAIVKTGVFNDENGDGCADAGVDTISYTFTVTNEGNVSLSNIVVDDPLLGGPIAGPDSGDDDSDGELDVTETWTYTASYTITQADIDAGSITNQATATGVAPDQSPVSDLSGSTATTDDGTITTLCQSPAIAIVKTGVFNDENGDDCADVDETISYTFTVTNEGNVSLSNIVVDDPLLGGPIAGPDSGDDDGDGELDVTETWTYTASYTITQADIDTGSVSNQAVASGIAPDQSLVNDSSGPTTTTDDVTITGLCQSPAIAIVKTGVFNDENGDGCADAGVDTISYTFTVTNEGNVSLSNIVVDDPLLGGPIAGPDSGDDDSDGELDVTETWTYTASYTITQADIDAGSITNQATATGVAPDQSPVSDLSGSTATTDDGTITTLCQSPAIAIVKTGVFNDENGDGCADVDETISYTFIVTNEGNVSLSNIVVDDPLLGGSIAGPDSGDDDNDGELDVTETWVYTASYTITQADIDAGSITNQATATGVAPDQSTVSDLSGSTTTTDDGTITTLCQNPSISLEKTGVFNDENGDGVTNVGETISYTFAVINTGNVTLYNIMITDPLPGINITGGPIAVLQPGETDNTTFTATYVITQEDINNGEIDNQAVVTGEDVDGNIVTDDSDDPTNPTNTDNNGDGEPDDITVVVLPGQNPSISLEKTGVFNDENGDGVTNVGETISYTFAVINTGNVTLHNIMITDPLPGIEIEGGPIAVLQPGETDNTTFTATYVITQEDINNGEIENQAVVTGEDAGGNIVTDDSDDPTDPTNTDNNGDGDPDDVTVVVLPGQNPSISLEKTGVFNDENGDGASDVGETISYTFAVINTGNVTLYNITITDPLPGIEIEGGPIAVLQPGETDDTTFTATYVITQEDIDNLEIENQAVVTGEDDGGNIVTDDSDDPTNPTNVDNNGDGDPDDVTVTVLPDVLSASFEIFNGITPDGDGLNEFFQIDGIENYPNNNVKIYNRWGVLVFETDGYGGSTGQDNVFRGISEGRVTVEKNKELPTGTYYYILTFPSTNPGKSSYSGYLYINR